MKDFNEPADFLRGGVLRQVARGLIPPSNPTIWLGNSHEGFHRRIVIFENLEEVENAYQAQALHRELGRLHQFDVPPTLLGASQKAHQQANSAGIDHGHFSKVDHNASVAATQCLLDGLTQAVNGGADPEGSPELNDLYL
jgi:hypothetical protein